jgi:urease accessory protein
LAVRAETDSEGRTVLRRLEVSAPFHLSKPYWTGEVLVVQAVNATAGVFAGDRLALEVSVLPGARVLLTAPSATRIHTMPNGRAEQRQSFQVAAGGWLDVMPELFIPQAGCRYRQETSIAVAPGGCLFFVETLAPGRVARGESFAFTEVAWSLNVGRGERRMLRERYTLRGGADVSTWSLRHPFPSGYYATCILVSDAVDLTPQRAAVEALASPFVQLGMTRFDACGWAVKILAADGTALRDALVGVRQALNPAFPHLRADARKL